MSVRPSIIIPNMPKLSRRSLLKFIAAAAPSAAIPKALLSQGASPHHIAPGPFQPSWDSLTAGYQTPNWFRDAKFGIWSCWGPESMPEQGDWYTRNLYLQGSKQNKFHVANYGHPSKFGAVEHKSLPGWTDGDGPCRTVPRFYENAVAVGPADGHAIDGAVVFSGGAGDGVELRLRVYGTVDVHSR